MTQKLSDANGAFRLLELTELVNAMVVGNSLKTFGAYDYVATVSPLIFEKCRYIDLERDNGKIVWVQMSQRNCMGSLETSMELDICVQMNQALLFDERGKASLENYAKDSLRFMEIKQISPDANCQPAACSVEEQ